jgi:hypothetical protein
MAKKTAAAPKSFKGASFNFGANKKSGKSKTGRKSTGPRIGKGPGGLPTTYGS